MQTASDLAAIVRRHARRARKVRAGGIGLYSLSAALVLLGLAALGASLQLNEGLLLAALLILAAAVALTFTGLAVSVLRSVDVVAHAKSLDDQLGLKDRLSSALAFARQHASQASAREGDFRLASIRDASRFAGRIAVVQPPGRPLRRPLVVLCLCAAVAVTLSLVDVTPDRGPSAPRNAAAALARSTPKAVDADSTEAKPDAAASDEGLTEVEESKIEDKTASSDLDDAAKQAMADLANSAQTSEADRLLAQAAYLNESDLGDSGTGGRSASGEDTMIMKEPDVDQLKEMVKDAQERKKRGEDQSGDSNDINLQLLIKRQSSGSDKPSNAKPKGRRSSGGGGGPSQDTRIQPKRVEVANKVEFKITSMRSLTPPDDSDAKRIVLNEAIMRTSGVPAPPMVNARDIPVAPGPQTSAPRFDREVPPDLRAYVSRYFEGLKD